MVDTRDTEQLPFDPMSAKAREQVAHLEGSGRQGSRISHSALPATFNNPSNSKDQLPVSDTLFIVIWSFSVAHRWKAPFTSPTPRAALPILLGETLSGRSKQAATNLVPLPLT
jgi:hypothetical protein